MQERIKIYLLMGACGLAFIYLLLCLYKIQIWEHQEFVDKRDNQNKLFNNSQKRGTIFATRKDGELVAVAVDEVWYKLIISPKDIPSGYEKRLYEILLEIVGKENPDFSNEEKFLKITNNKKDSYEELALLDKQQAEKIEELKIFGVYTDKNYKRVYPENEVIAKVLGFIGDGESGISGKYGLEKYYEQDLSGGKMAKPSFFSEIFSLDRNYDSGIVTDLVTTLEPNVSIFIYDLLEKMKKEWEADTVAVIVMKVDTGEIISMEALPSFDPNKFSEFKIENFTNPSINGVYELGSIMKPITMSAGINEKLITPNSYFRDYGFVKVDEYTIKNFDEKVRGDVTMQQVISDSLNTGAVYVQQLLGMEKFKKYFDAFGLKENTGIDFPNEAVNLVNNLDGNIRVNFATAAFGQGVAVTPMSMLLALNIIANEGRKVCPHFLKYKLHSDNSKTDFECILDEVEENDLRVISTETANTTKQMMIELVENGLAKGRYKDVNYFVGAKTGTAQLPSPDGKYYKDKFVHSYFTFFPGENPEFSVLIYQVNPKQGSLASLTLAPYATKIKDFLLDYYNIPPDR